MKDTVNVLCYRLKVLLYEIQGASEIMVHKLWYFFNLLT